MTYACFKIPDLNLVRSYWHHFTQTSFLASDKLWGTSFSLINDRVKLNARVPSKDSKIFLFHYTHTPHEDQTGLLFSRHHCVLELQYFLFDPHEHRHSNIVIPMTAGESLDPVVHRFLRRCFVTKRRFHSSLQSFYVKHFLKSLRPNSILT